MSEADNIAIQDPFKMGVLTTLLLIAKTLKVNPGVNTQGVISEAEKLIAQFPLGDKPLDQQGEHTLALRWFLSGLR